LSNSVEKDHSLEKGDIFDSIARGSSVEDDGDWLDKHARFIDDFTREGR